MGERKIKFSRGGKQHYKRKLTGKEETRKSFEKINQSKLSQKGRTNEEEYDQTFESIQIFKEKENEKDYKKGKQIRGKDESESEEIKPQTHEIELQKEYSEYDDDYENEYEIEQ